MSILREKLEEYKSLKEGTQESVNMHLSMCNIYNQAGYEPKLKSTCYCNRTTNIKYIEKVCS